MKRNYLILIVFLLICGCDLLSTRDAEPPGNARSNYQSPVTPELVIENLINSFKDQNIENYISCFANPSFSEKGFLFIPSSGATAQFPSLAEEWDLKDEDQYFRNMISKVPSEQSITLLFSDEEFRPFGDTLIFAAGYTLNVPHNQADLPTNFKGEVRFSMIRDSRSFWSIYYWQDNKNSITASWSELKGRFY